MVVLIMVFSTLWIRIHSHTENKTVVAFILYTCLYVFYVFCFCFLFFLGGGYSILIQFKKGYILLLTNDFLRELVIHIL